MKHIYDFSIVIPTYNGQDTIGRLLDQCASLLTKTHKGQVIIIDSSSNDNTISIVNSYRKKIENLKLINIKKQEFNHGTTRNIGVKHAKSKYICFFSQDISLVSNGIFRHLADDFMLNKRVVAIYGKQIPYSTRDIIQRLDILCDNNRIESYIDRNNRVIKDKKNPFTPYISDNYHLWWSFSNAFSCYRTSYIKMHLFSQTQYGEDLLAARDAIENGNIVIYDSNIIAQHSHNFTNKEYRIRLKKDIQLRSSLYPMKKSHTLECKLRLLNQMESSYFDKICLFFRLMYQYLIKLYYKATSRYHL